MSKENTGKKSSRMEKVIIPVLLVLVTLLGYSVGVLNGKHMSDRQYSMKESQQENINAMNEEASDEGALSDDEINAIAKDAMENAEGTATELAKEDQETLPGDATHGTAPIVAQKSAVKAPVMAKTQVKEDDRAPSSIQKKAADTLQYTVQVASYADFKDAENMAVALHKKGYPAFSFKVDIKGQTWHRVSIGGFRTKKEAVDLQSELQKAGVVKDSYVQKLSR